MRFLFLFITILMLISCLQEKHKAVIAENTNIDNIIPDSNFYCGGSRTQSEAESHLDYICNSKNNIEIRLTLNPELMFGFKVYVLANNTNKWNLVEYKYNYKTLSKDSLHPIKITEIKSTQTVKNLFDTLKQNNVFTLPDQKEIDVGSYSVDDGAWYTLTFKIGSKYRKYEFNNPDIYTKEFSNKEFINYLNIVNAFEDLFEKDY